MLMLLLNLLAPATPRYYCRDNPVLTFPKGPWCAGHGVVRVQRVHQRRFARPCCFNTLVRPWHPGHIVRRHPSPCTNCGSAKEHTLAPFAHDTSSWDYGAVRVDSTFFVVLSLVRTQGTLSDAIHRGEFAVLPRPQTQQQQQQSPHDAGSPAAAGAGGGGGGSAGVAGTAGAAAPLPSPTPGDRVVALRSLIRTAAEVARGMEHLHLVHAVVHGDIKVGVG